MTLPIRRIPSIRFPALPGQFEYSVLAASNKGLDRRPFSNSAMHLLDAVGRPGVKHRACRVGAPLINIGHRQRHGSHVGRTRRPLAADCARLLNVVALHRRKIDPVFVEIQRMTANPGQQSA